MKEAADRHHIAPACGGCGSTRIMLTTGDCTHAVCQDCLRLQEAETRADPNRHLCDNCAWRPGSAERADPWGWMRITERAIEEGEPFYCHKGMAARLEGDSLRFLPGDDLSVLQPCAGWQAAYKAHLARQAKIPARD